MEIHEEVRVAGVGEVPPEGLLSVDFAGTRVLLADVGGTVHAVRDECSHEGAPLSDGEAEDGTVECPWHFSRFCLRTGKALDLPATEPVEAFRARVVDGEILLSRARDSVG